MKRNRKFLVIIRGIAFSIILAFPSLSCFSQTVTTRAPDGFGMIHIDGDSTTYDNLVYVFELNNEVKISLAMSFTNDTINICPYISNTTNRFLFSAIAGHELAHYYNYVLHDEIIKTDTSKQFVDPVNWGTPPNLKRNVYKGGDGSSVKNAIIIKKTITLKEGIAAEYAYLGKKLGQRGIDWKPLGQYLHPIFRIRTIYGFPDYAQTAHLYYDIIKVKIIDTNEIKYFCFDITDVFGKF